MPGPGRGELRAYIFRIGLLRFGLAMTLILTASGVLRSHTLTRVPLLSSAFLGEVLWRLFASAVGSVLGGVLVGCLYWLFLRWSFGAPD